MDMSPLRSFVFAICVGVAVWGFTTAILKSAEAPTQTTLTVEEHNAATTTASEETVEEHSAATTTASEEAEKAQAVEQVRPTIGSMVKIAMIFVGVTFALMLTFVVFRSVWSTQSPKKDKDTTTDNPEATVVKDQDSVKPFLNL